MNSFNIYPIGLFSKLLIVIKKDANTQIGVWLYPNQDKCRAQGDLAGEMGTTFVRILRINKIGEGYTCFRI